MKRILITGASILALGFGFAPVAQAASLPVYATLAECNQDVNARNASVGGPLSGVYYSCNRVGWVPNGVAGCPPAGVNDDGCIGDHWQVTENRA